MNSDQVQGPEDGRPTPSGRRVFRSPRVLVVTAVVVVIAAVSAFFLLNGSQPVCARSGATGNSNSGNTPSCVNSGVSGTTGG